MDPKVYPAFGWLIVRTKLKAGELVTDEMILNNIFVVHDATPGVKGKVGNTGYGYVWFLISGKQSYLDLRTNELDIHEPGWCNLVNPMHAGTFEFESITDSEYICFSPVLNESRSPRIPDLEYVEMQEGETRMFPQGTKLYLIEGDLEINGKVIPSMRQIHVATSDAHALAKRKTWGLIFKV